VQVLAGQLVAEYDAPARGALERNVVDRPRPVAGGLGVENQLDAQPLRIADLRVVVRGGAQRIGVEGRAARQRLVPRCETVLRHDPVPAGEHVVELQPDLDHDRSAVGRAVAPEVKEASDCRQRAGQSAEQRDGCRQGPYVVRRVDQQAVALEDGLANQAKLAELQVPQPAVDHPRRCGIDQQHVDALEGQLAEQSRAVDPGPDDKHRHLRLPAKLIDHAVASG